MNITGNIVSRSTFVPDSSSASDPQIFWGGGAFSAGSASGNNIAGIERSTSKSVPAYVVSFNASKNWTGVN